MISNLTGDISNPPSKSAKITHFITVTYMYALYIGCRHAANVGLNISVTTVPQH